MMPLKKYTLSSDKQNYFGAKRKYDYHTGLDLFCDEDSEVYSIYTGVVTAIIEFTGYSESPWWNDTKAVMIFHPEINKTFLYGEISTTLKVGKVLHSGDLVGNVKRVLKNDKGKPTTMLHLECYKGLQTKAVWWYHDDKCPKNLEDNKIFKYEKSNCFRWWYF